MSALAIVLAAAPLLGDLAVGDVRPAEAEHRVEVDVSWANGWRNARNHDAVWLVLRDPSDAEGGTLTLAPDGHEAAGEIAAHVVVSEDGVGAFVEPTAEHRGDVRWTVSLRLAEAPPENVEAWAVEMVRIPSGAFELGDDAPGVLAKGGFFRPDDDGRPAGPVAVASEAALELGDALAFDPGRNPQYTGDTTGTLPASFPKGTQAFYVMKYELRQGEYARFVNALPAEWRAVHAPVPPNDEEADTCSITESEGVFTAGAPERPCNFVTWSDTSAWMDWMGLRPMTEFEFEKAARGPRRPTPADFPWGDASRDGVRRTVQPTRDLAAATAEDERALDDETRRELAASYYWVMDLSGSLWERVVSAGHPRGRAFLGSHGDGRLSNGTATNADWPVQVERDAPGIGYRGGADYFGPEPNETNPFSCVGTRQYAAWSGAYRYKTYSARGVRTAPR